MRALAVLMLAVLLLGCTPQNKDCGSHKHQDSWVEAGSRCTCDNGDVACTRIPKDGSECITERDCTTKMACPSVAACMQGECVYRCLTVDEFERSSGFQVLGCNASINVSDIDSMRLTSTDLEGNNTVVLQSYVPGDCGIKAGRGYYQVFRGTLVLFYEFPPVDSGCQCAIKVVHRIPHEESAWTDLLIAPLFWADGITNMLCDEFSPCLPGMDCVLYPDATNGVCARAPYCQNYRCPDNAACQAEGSKILCVTDPS
ncbi:MAG: hypothetical protein V1735_07610 [Nanoarchaeota archaeon]